MWTQPRQEHHWPRQTRTCRFIHFNMSRTSSWTIGAIRTSGGALLDRFYPNWTFINSMRKEHRKGAGPQRSFTVDGHDGVFVPSWWTVWCHLFLMGRSRRGRAPSRRCSWLACYISAVSSGVGGTILTALKLNKCGSPVSTRRHQMFVLKFRSFEAKRSRFLHDDVSSLAGCWLTNTTTTHNTTNRGSDRVQGSRGRPEGRSVPHPDVF